MLDKTKIRAYNSNLSQDSFIENALSKLDNVKQVSASDYNCYYGFLNDLRVKVNGNYLTIDGSFARFYFGSNIQNLTRKEIQETFNLLSETFKINLDFAEVQSFEIAKNFKMEYTPEVYYPYLGNSSYFNRFIQDNSLYYQKANIQKVFYDKMKERTFKKATIPDILNGSNLLRYELRIQKRVKEVFKSNVIVKDLYNETFYIRALNLWYSEYKAIDKLRLSNINTDHLNTTKDLIQLLAIKGLESIGIDETNRLIAEAKALGKLTNNEAFSRMKRTLKDLTNNSKQSINSSLIDELDRKVKQSIEYYR